MAARTQTGSGPVSRRRRPRRRLTPMCGRQPARRSPKRREPRDRRGRRPPLQTVRSRSPAGPDRNLARLRRLGSTRCPIPPGEPHRSSRESQRDSRVPKSSDSECDAAGGGRRLMWVHAASVRSRSPPAIRTLRLHPRVRKHSLPRVPAVWKVHHSAACRGRRGMRCPAAHEWSSLRGEGAAHLSGAYRVLAQRAVGTIGLDVSVRMCRCRTSPTQQR